MAKGGLEEEEATAEMAQHFRLCDADSDGFLTFSQFLRWVELCDLNPEDHVQVRHNMKQGSGAACSYDISVQ